MKLARQAIEAYRLADAKEKLMKVGDKCLEEGHITEAIASFKKEMKQYVKDQEFEKARAEIESYKNSSKEIKAEKTENPEPEKNG